MEDFILSGVLTIGKGCQQTMFALAFRLERIVEYTEAVLETAEHKNPSETSEQASQELIGQ